MKFGSKMLKSGNSPIPSIVGSLWIVFFLHFLCFNLPIIAKNSNNPPREKHLRMDFTMTKV